jgi:hypothetical protein
LPGRSHWVVVGVVLAHSGAAATAVGEDIATSGRRQNRCKTGRQRQHGNPALASTGGCRSRSLTVRHRILPVCRTL